MIAKNIDKVRSTIAEIVLNSGLSYTPRLVCVSKTKPVALLQECYAAGERHFGENYMQELVTKAPQLPSDIQWHFIGRLQSGNCNKLLKSVPNLYAVETVDSAKLATSLNKAAVNAERKNPLRVFVQVNTSGEASKSGCVVEEAVPLVNHIRSTCPKLQFAGLMTIGYKGDINDFKKLAAVRQAVADELKMSASELELSMGMSSDFAVAIEHGSTNVRVGSTIFGAREYPQQQTVSANSVSTPAEAASETASPA